MVARPRIPALALLLLGACQHQSQLAPAQLVEAPADTVQHIKAELARAVGRAEIELGAGDLTGASTLTVLPPRLASTETRSTAVPTVFDVFIRGEACLAVQRGTEIEISLPDGSCRPT